ncbi:hypothetical protein [Marivivens marinus]|uniref:hypothetical protein n=1 Tax=Marivivens marinus TaxID=3110173 RepID=UPI003B846228
MTNFPTLALHVGPHKTATTHLQRAMERNKERLIAHGVRFYGPDYLRDRGRNVSGLFGLAGGRASHRAPHDQLRFLAKDGHRVILSEENFFGRLREDDGSLPQPLYPDGPAKVADLVSVLPGVEVELFISLRHPLRMIASMYSQLIYSRIYMTPEDFCAAHDPAILDWLRILTDLTQIDGLAAINVWRYEDYNRIQNRLIPALLGEAAADGFEPEPGRPNVGLSQEGMEWVFAQLAADPNADPIDTARARFPVAGGRERMQLYSDDIRAAEDRRYTAQIAAIRDLPKVRFIDPTAQA